MVPLFYGNVADVSVQENPDVSRFILVYYLLVGKDTELTSAFFFVILIP